jgi:hypothetical protein
MRSARACRAAPPAGIRMRLRAGGAVASLPRTGATFSCRFATVSSTVATMLCTVAPWPRIAAGTNATRPRTVAATLPCTLAAWPCPVAPRHAIVARTVSTVPRTVAPLTCIETARPRTVAVNT